MILRGFIQVKALNLVPPLIVHPSLHCRHHCFFAMFSGFLAEIIVPLLWEARSLVVQARPRFRSFWVSSVDDSQERLRPINNWFML